jgi:hypothetical protein
MTWLAGKAGMLAVLPVAATLLLAGPAQAAPTDRGHLLMVSVPGLTWADVAGAGSGLATLRGLVAGSAVANLSTRTVTATTYPADGYATVGAGARATAADPDGALAAGADEPVEGGTGATAYTRRTGRTATGAVLQLAADAIRATNDDQLYGARPGLLASTLHDAHRSTAVIANADLAGSWHREAALAVMDTDGAVDNGTVSPGLRTAARTAPEGIALDPTAVDRALDTAWPASDVVLVEAGDLYRLDLLAEPDDPADADGPDVPADQGGPVVADPSDDAARVPDRQRADALRRTDALLATLLSRVDPDRDTVLLFSPAPAPDAPGMGVFALRGPGVRPGLAVSASTRRTGYVTLPDLAPTILHRFGLAVPAAMSGTPVTTGQPRATPTGTGTTGPPGATGEPTRAAALTAAGTARELAADNDRAVFRDRTYGTVTVVFLVMIVALCGLAVAAVLRPRLTLPAAGLALAVLAIPPLTFLSGLVRYAALGVVGYPLVLVATAAATAAAGILFARRRPASAARLGSAAGRPASAAGRGSPGGHWPGRWAPLALGLVGIGWLVQVVDVLTGAWLQLDTVFGYSPVVAGRFAGVGNQSFALLAATAVLLVAGGWAVLTHRYGRPVVANPAAGDVRPVSGAGAAGLPDGGRRLVGWWWRGALGGAVVVLVVTVVVDGAGGLGADVGGVLAAVPGFAVLLALLAGVRLGWRKAVGILGLTVLVIGGFAVVDLLRPAGSRTHLGRFVAGVGSGDTLVIERKVAANLNVLTSSAWTWLVPVVCAFLVVWGVRRTGVLDRLRGRVPGLGAALVALAVVGGLGFALNDSGIAVPTMMAAVLVPYLVLLHADGQPDGQPAEQREQDHPVAGGGTG